MRRALLALPLLLVATAAHAQSVPYPSANVAAFLSPTVTNPSSTLTRPADTTAYAQNDIIASSTTAGAIVVPSVAIGMNAGGVSIPRVRLVTNITAGWDQVTIRVRLWSRAPTYTNGDNGIYAVATGAAGFLGVFDVTLNQFGDGAASQAAPSAGAAVWARLATGSAIYWDMQYIGAATLTPTSGQAFTLTAELAN